MSKSLHQEGRKLDIYVLPQSHMMSYTFKCVDDKNNTHVYIHGRLRNPIFTVLCYLIM